MPLPEDDLDARIAAATRTLVEREQRVAAGFATLGRRTRRAVAPARLAATGAGVLLAGAALWWLLRRGAAPAPTVQNETGRSAPPSSPSPLPPMAGLLGLAWPLLPARWRSRLNPGLVALAVDLGWPLVRRLLQRPVWPEMATVAQVDPARFAGRWQELARLGAAATGPRPPSVDYEPAEDGSFSVERRWHAADGQEQAERGVARAVPGSGGAKLELSFEPPWLRLLPQAWSEHQILALDRGYTVALVAHPNRLELAVLARGNVATPLLDALLAVARGEGFEVERLGWWAGAAAGEQPR
ncbi:lipocalin [Rubrivivax gelatinosus]|nr:lipocalin [Rubrivivax gelatinosus]